MWVARRIGNSDDRSGHRCRDRSAAAVDRDPPAGQAGRAAPARPSRPRPSGSSSSRPRARERRRRPRASRSTKIPDARSVPPGRSSATSASASVDEHRRDQVGEDDVERPVAAGDAPLAGRDPRARAGSAARSRGVASTAIGSTSTREDLAGAQQRGGDRQDPGAAARRRGPGRRRASSAPRPPSASSAARHSRVVGWSPVPKAIPGSSASTTSSGCAAMPPPCRPDHDPPADPQHREVRLPGVRPVGLVDDARRQLADRPQPEGLEMAELALGAVDGRPDGRRRRSAGRCGPDDAPAATTSTRAPRPSSTSSNAGSTLVPPGAARDRISDTASTASWSAATESSSQVPGPATAASRSIPVERLAGRRAVASPQAQLLAQPGVRRHRLAGVASRTPRAARAGAWSAWSGRRRWRSRGGRRATDCRRRCGTPRPVSRISVPGLRARLDLDLDVVALDRRHHEPRAERRLDDREVGLVVELGALAGQGRVRRRRGPRRRGCPAGPPRGPTSPSFESRIWWPSSMPGGDRDPEACACARSGPRRGRCRTASSMTLPSPRQRGHGATFTIWPSIVWRTDRISPRPLHCGQVVAVVPGFAPDAAARLAAAEDRELDLLLGAEDRLLERDPEVVPEVRARAAGRARRLPPAAAPPKKASKMSEKPPKPCAPAPIAVRPRPSPPCPNMSYAWRRWGSERTW